jgi:flagellar operon protein
MIHHITPEQFNVERIDQQQKTGNLKSTRTSAQQKDFKQILSEKVQSSELKFSAHANKRLEMRGIRMDQDDLASLEEAVDLADSKGSREALVIHNKAAFVVSVRNRTVITAIDASDMKERIVTNIDSAVIARDL